MYIDCTDNNQPRPSVNGGGIIRSDNPKIKMKANKILPESTFYGLAFLLALGLRLYQLGAAPLSEAEAGWALQALGLAHGQAVTVGSQPAYILITSQLFSILGDTNFLARFIPALAGSLLIWLPFYFRPWLGDSINLKRAGMVMAFGLAIDPGLVSLSRQAGSLMPAMAFTLLALAGLCSRRMIWAGIFAGLALLSGPPFLQGLLILGIGWGLYRLLVKETVAAKPEAGDAEQPVATAPRAFAPCPSDQDGCNCPYPDLAVCWLAFFTRTTGFGRLG